ncbi:helix-turn-helix domain-containing protein [Streptomyces formicae]|uniref:Helix-turn-helix domain-containing protein n=1 Tax=Streptomyces formicae TaxID=1616117 RepID=A0ABY3WNT4_9ACTN|nr:helix-turn-helix domain-containing protein [Streptomyces formicae]UNM13795.1 helix-turn-helix domain-containing protein [Streptomyces formicae]
MLRVKEVATRLNVHPATVYRWIKDGHLPAVRYGKPQVVGSAIDGPGGAIRIPESALAAFTLPTEGEAA